MPSLCVIVPAFNEAACIQDAIRQITSVLSGARDDALFQLAQLFVVDDGSTDDTATLAEQLAQADPRVKVVSYQPNRGK
ncbi:MAG TPA: glycosyltransferase, partial [Thermoflexales bacterium]|nr:glycosyltransferase [Thermoflexales bacterium]